MWSVKKNKIHFQLLVNSCFFLIYRTTERWKAAGRMQLLTYFCRSLLLSASKSGLKDWEVEPRMLLFLIFLLISSFCCTLATPKKRELVSFARVQNFSQSKTVLSSVLKEGSSVLQKYSCCKEAVCHPVPADSGSCHFPEIDKILAAFPLKCSPFSSTRLSLSGWRSSSFLLEHR